MNLLLVEDDVEYAASLSEELRALEHEVTVANCGRTALDAVEAIGFDAVIMDRMLPRMDGARVIERFRDLGRTLPVLILSALGRSADKVEGLDSGADDYVVKPASAAELDARLRALLRARGWSNDQDNSIRVADILVTPAKHRAWRSGKALDLTRIEFKLLHEFVRDPDAVLTRTMLLQKVWGYDFEPATNVVDAKIHSLRKKLMKLGDDPIITIRGVGYMLRS